MEEVKQGVLQLLGERDQWRIPVVITLAPAPKATEVLTPVTLRLTQTPEGPTIQLGVSIGADPAAVHLQRHVVRAIMLDFLYRDHPPQGGQAYVEAPWWFVSGVIEKFRQAENGLDAEIYRRLIGTNKLPAVADFLPGHGQEFGGAAAAFDDACAFALLQLLFEQPEGKVRMTGLLRQWPDSHGDAMGLLIRFFPTIGPDANAVQKWWTLNLARFAASDRYRGLSAEDTDRELQALLSFDVGLDKQGHAQRFGVGQFKEFLRLKGGKAAAKKQQAAVVALSLKANALLRPVLSDYEQIFALLAAGRTRGVEERIHAAETYRTAVLERKTEIADYLNWYEATQLGTRSGAFDHYLRMARAVESEPQITVTSAAISAYLDLLEDQL